MRTSSLKLLITLLLSLSLPLFGCEADKDSSDGEPSAGESVAGESTAGESTAGESTAGESVAGESTAGESVAGESTAGESVAGESTAGESVAGEYTAGESVAGESTAGESGAGDSGAGDSGAGESGAGESVAGDEVIIEVAGEDGEEWIDPEDFGEDGEGIHSFVMTDINGEEVDMRRYRGRVTLVVNVASRCGYTRQYEDLQNLYEMYRERGLVILGFPANNFGMQEPGTEEEIAEFCSANYGVNFPMFSKISVKGADIHPLYQYLVGESGREVSWNFNKFLVGPDGLFVSHFLSGTEPLSDELVDAIEPLLAAE